MLSYILISSIQIGLSIAYRRHVDPSKEAEQTPYPRFLSMLVVFAFDDLVNWNFTGTLARLKQFNLIFVPPTLRFAFDRFGQLMEALTTTLEEVERLLDESESLINIGRGEDARLLLNQASYQISSANITYNTLKSSVKEVTKTLSLPENEVFERLDALGELLRKIQERLLSLLNLIEEQRNLKETFLEVETYPETVWVGSNLTIRGKLYTINEHLSLRSVSILLDGEVVSEVKTSDDGTFEQNIKVPYLYKPKMVIQAKYTPGEEDREVFKPTASNTLEVNLLYILPHLDVKAVEKALPGKYFAIEGSLGAEMPYPYRQVRVYWVNETIVLQMGEDGTFKAILYTPEAIAEGKYVLKADAPPSGIFAPATATSYVDIQRMPLNVTLDIPQVVFAGVEASIKGKVNYPGIERFNVTAKLDLGREEHWEATSGEEFDLKINPSMTTLTEYQTYRIQVNPQLPWYSKSSVEGTFLIVNPLTISIPVGVISIFSVKFLKEDRRKAVKGEQEALTETATQRTYQKEYYVEKGLEWLMDSYWQAVVVVSNITGVEIAPSMTIREYLNITKPRLGEVYESFEKLSEMAEKALYSPSIIEEELEVARKAMERLQVKHVASLH